MCMEKSKNFDEKIRMMFGEDEVPIATLCIESGG